MYYLISDQLDSTKLQEESSVSTPRMSPETTCCCGHIAAGHAGNGRCLVMFRAQNPMPKKPTPNPCLCETFTPIHKAVEHSTPLDLEITVYYASDQLVNENPRAVRLTHLPTGIIAISESRRTALQNEVVALRELAESLIVHESSLEGTKE
jgi:hypothetical protein